MEANAWYRAVRWCIVRQRRAASPCRATVLSRDNAAAVTWNAAAVDHAFSREERWASAACPSRSKP